MSSPLATAWRPTMSVLHKVSKRSASSSTTSPPILGREVAPSLAEHHDDPAGHVLAQAVAYALDHRVAPEFLTAKCLVREASGSTLLRPSPHRSATPQRRRSWSA